MKPFVSSELEFRRQRSVLHVSVVVDFPCQVSLVKDFKFANRVQNRILHRFVYKIRKSMTAE